jgi:hypothetical protein
MSRSTLSFLAASLLLAAIAQAVDLGASAPASAAAPANRTVKIFVTMRDESGKVLPKASVRIEGDDSADIGVGPEGAKLSLPAARDSTLQVLFPGGNCGITLTPKLVAGGRVAIGVARDGAGHRCALEDAAQAGKAASAVH